MLRGVGACCVFRFGRVVIGVAWLAFAVLCVAACLCCECVDC